MKKFFMTFIAMLMMSVASVASNVMAECEMVHGGSDITEINKKEVVYHTSPEAYITFIIGDDRIDFVVYEQEKKEDGTLYVYGKGSHGVNVFSINKNTVEIALCGDRKLVVNSKRVVEQLEEILR